MKRLILSLVGGFVIPFLYTLIVGPLTNYIENYRLRQLLGYPVRWPVIILQETLPLDSFPFRDEDLGFLLVLVIACDVIVYGIVTYILLWRFWKPKTKESGPPPEPPRFESLTN